MRTTRLSRVVVALVLQCSIVFTVSAMPLTNGDFSSGFDGWAGQVTDVFFLTNAVDPLSGPYPDNFDASTGEAVLTTTTLVNDIFSVVMFQTFDLPAIAPGETLKIFYDVAVMVSDPDPIFGDFAFAQLNHGPGFFMSIDLLGTSMQDITALAGETVELLFGVEDFDGGIICFVDCDDVMTVDNIVIDVIAAQVPEPGSLGLFALGMLAVGAAHARRASRTLFFIGT